MAEANEKKKPSINSSTTVSGSYDFWKVLESHTGVEIAAHVKNLLSINSLDNPLAFRNITGATLNQLEKFSRDTMKMILDPEDDPQDFYGHYHRSPGKFKFMIGDRHLIGELVDFVKSKPQEFWKPAKLVAPTVKDVQRRSRYKNPRKANDVPGSSESPNVSTLNAEAERKKISKKIETCVAEERARSNRGKWKTLSTSKVDVVVTGLKVKQGGNSPRPSLYDAKVRCAICPKYMKINSHRTGDCTNWNIANYKRHLQCHTGDKNAS